MEVLIEQNKELKKKKDMTDSDYERVTNKSFFLEKY
jgi:hypothetical protein